MTSDGQPASDLPGILSSVESAHSGLNEAGESAGETPNQSTSEDAFALVGNEIRAEIIRTLGAHDADDTGESTLGFADLRAAAETDVVSSQFNYHLQKLVGHYVEKTDEGYRLRPEGKMLYRTIRAGVFTRRDSLSPVALDQGCYYCDDQLKLAYDDGMFTVQCHGCETLYDLILAPPSAVRTDEKLQARVEGYNYHLRQAFAQGVCPTCVNPLETELLDPAETGFTDVVERDLYVYQSCGYCGNHSYLSLGSLFLHHPAVIGFCYEQGLDVMTTPRWEIPFAATDRYLSVRSTDPWEIVLEVPVDGVTLELVVDDQLSILDHSVSASPADEDI